MAVVEQDLAGHASRGQVFDSFASTLLMAGVNPVALAKAMVHKDTRMIEKHCGHLIPGCAGQEIDRKAPRLDLDP